MVGRHSGYGSVSLPTLDELPPAPPRLVLPATDCAPEVAGQVFVANWSAKAPGVDRSPPEESMAWPAPAVRHGRTTFEIGFAYPPRWGFVNVFHSVDAGTGLPADPRTGAPTEIPELTLDLREFAGVEGLLMPDGDVVRFWAMPDEMAPSEYVVVQLGWTAMRRPAGSGPPFLPSAELDAAWAFRFENG